MPFPLNILDQNLLRNQAASGAVSAPIDCRGYAYLTIYFEGTGTIASGVVTVETAHWNASSETPYTGTWSAVTTYNASGVTGGAQDHLALTTGAYAWIRLRITTVLAGTDPLISADIVGV
jgi:hypothetical protein